MGHSRPPPNAPRGKEPAKGAAGRYAFVSEVSRTYLGPLWVARDPADASPRGTVFVRHVAPVATAGARAALLEAARWAVTVRGSDDTEFVEGRTSVDLVTPYVDGESIRALLRTMATKHAAEGPPALLGIARELLQELVRHHALAASDKVAWAFGGVHPDSILVGADGRVHFLDVGIGSAASSREPFRSDVQRIGYAAPEQLDAKATADARTDVFSIGIFLWEGLTGRRLFPGNDTKTARERVQKGPIQRLDATRPTGVAGVAPAIADFVARALERDPAARFQTAAEMLAAVEELECASVGGVGEWVTSLAGVAISKRRQVVERAQVPDADAPAPSGRAASLPPPPASVRGAMAPGRVSSVPQRQSSVGPTPPVRASVPPRPPAEPPKARASVAPPAPAEPAAPVERPKPPASAPPPPAARATPAPVAPVPPGVPSAAATPEPGRVSVVPPRPRASMAPPAPRTEDSGEPPPVRPAEPPAAARATEAEAEAVEPEPDDEEESGAAASAEAGSAEAASASSEAAEPEGTAGAASEAEEAEAAADEEETEVGDDALLSSSAAAAAEPPAAPAAPGPAEPDHSLPPPLPPGSKTGETMAAQVPASLEPLASPMRSASPDESFEGLRPKRRPLLLIGAVVAVLVVGVVVGSQFGGRSASSRAKQAASAAAVPVATIVSQTAASGSSEPTAASAEPSASAQAAPAASVSAAPSAVPNETPPAPAETAPAAPAPEPAATPRAEAPSRATEETPRAPSSREETKPRGGGSRVPNAGYKPGGI